MRSSQRVRQAVPLLLSVPGALAWPTITMTLRSLPSSTVTLPPQLGLACAVPLGGAMDTLAVARAGHPAPGWEQADASSPRTPRVTVTASGARRPAHVPPARPRYLVVPHSGPLVLLRQRPQMMQRRRAMPW